MGLRAELAAKWAAIDAAAAREEQEEAEREVMGEHSHLPLVFIHTLETHAPVLTQAARRAKLAEELAAKKQLEEAKVREITRKRCLNAIGVGKILRISFKLGRAHSLTQTSNNSFQYIN